MNSAPSISAKVVPTLEILGPDGMPYDRDSSGQIKIERLADALVLQVSQLVTPGGESGREGRGALLEVPARLPSFVSDLVRAVEAINNGGFEQLNLSDRRALLERVASGVDYSVLRGMQPEVRVDVDRLIKLYRTSLEERTEVLDCIERVVQSDGISLSQARHILEISLTAQAVSSDLRELCAATLLERSADGSPYQEPQQLQLIAHYRLEKFLCGQRIIDQQLESLSACTNAEFRALLTILERSELDVREGLPNTCSTELTFQIDFKTSINKDGAFDEEATGRLGRFLNNWMGLNIRSKDFGAQQWEVGSAHDYEHVIVRSPQLTNTTGGWRELHTGYGLYAEGVQRWLQQFGQKGQTVVDTMCICLKTEEPLSYAQRRALGSIVNLSFGVLEGMTNPSALAPKSTNRAEVFSSSLYTNSDRPVYRDTHTDRICFNIFPAPRTADPARTRSALLERRISTAMRIVEAAYNTPSRQRALDFIPIVASSQLKLRDGSLPLRHNLDTIFGKDSRAKKDALTLLLVSEARGTSAAKGNPHLNAESILEEAGLSSLYKTPRQKGAFAPKALEAEFLTRPWFGPEGTERLSNVDKDPTTGQYKDLTPWIYGSLALAQSDERAAQLFVSACLQELENSKRGHFRQACCSLMMLTLACNGKVQEAAFEGLVEARNTEIGKKLSEQKWINYYFAAVARDCSNPRIRERATALAKENTTDVGFLTATTRPSGPTLEYFNHTLRIARGEEGSPSDQATAIWRVSNLLAVARWEQWGPILGVLDSRIGCSDAVIEGAVVNGLAHYLTWKDPHAVRECAIRLGKIIRGETSSPALDATQERALCALENPVRGRCASADAEVISQLYKTAISDQTPGELRARAITALPFISSSSVAQPHTESSTAIGALLDQRVSWQEVPLLGISATVIAVTGLAMNGAVPSGIATAAQETLEGICFASTDEQQVAWGANLILTAHGASDLIRSRAFQTALRLWEAHAGTMQVQQIGSVVPEHILRTIMALNLSRTAPIVAGGRFFHLAPASSMGIVRLSNRVMSHISNHTGHSTPVAEDMEKCLRNGELVSLRSRDPMGYQIVSHCGRMLGLRGL